MAGLDRSACTPEEMFGLSVALTTPFNEDQSIDVGRMLAHAKRLLEEGCTRLTLFGTTGEGVSLTQGERTAILDGFAADIDPARLVVGISATAVDSAVEQGFTALDAGIETLLVPPPFYFKGVSEEGLFAWYSRFFERIGQRGPRVLLYHIPQMTAVGLPLALVRMLKQQFGSLVLGVKDSEGHWPTTESFLTERDLCVLVGDERHLAKAVRLGGAGAISGMANVFPGELADLVRTGQDNACLNKMVDSLVKLPVTPAIKALVGLRRQEEGWNRVRAPLEATPEADVQTLRNLVNELERMRAA